MSHEAITWDSLRLLRMHGKKPVLPLIVTTFPELPRRLDGVGAMVIQHEPGTPLPVKLLDGLDVIFMLDECGKADAVWRLMQARGVKPSRMRAWCDCAGMLVIASCRCDSYAESIQWLEGTRNAKPH